MDLEFPDEPEPSRFVEFRAKEGQLIRFSASDIIDQVRNDGNLIGVTCKNVLYNTIGILCEVI